MDDLSQPSSPAVPANDAPKPIKKLIATQSLHGDFLERSSPQWLVDTTPVRKQALKDAGTVMPAWFANATPEQRNEVTGRFLANLITQTQLDNTMAAFQDIDDFARPLLRKALKDQYRLDLDVDKNLLCLRRPLAAGTGEVEPGDFEFLKLSLLEAALHNFEAYECKEGAYHKTSGFMQATGTSGTYHSVAINLKVSQFLTLCRDLDIGAKYQAYLQGFFYPEDASAQATLREQFIANQKAAVRAAAEQALLSGDIEAADHRMLLAVIDGEIHPWMGDKQVWFRTLGLMHMRMTGCMVFSICKKYSYPDEVIVYVPQDPEHPLKRYRWRQMEAEFKRLLTARDPARPNDPAPTPYQQFFSRFVPYDKRPYYFSQFTRKAADSPSDSPSDIGRSPWKKLVDFFNTPIFNAGIKEVPPEAPARLEPNPDPILYLSTRTRRGKAIWAENIDPWKYFYEQHREQVIADARAHAVPTADVDAKARDAKLAHLLESGMPGLNMMLMFVPVLGEAMMVVMAGQLLYETLEGVIEWSEGDRQAAKAHLIDVAENLAQIAVMAGVMAGVSRWQAAKAEPVIEALGEVKRPDGQVRLWKPSLSRYESPVVLPRDLHPNALGQYVQDGRTYIRQGSQVYEQYLDAQANTWRIKHPTDTEAYQPLLEHNGHGAWRHTLERPLEWDRLMLLRRMGHDVEAFSDTELLKVADVSGVSDNTLRKMHMDHTAAPPELADAIRLFKADADAARVIEQLEGTRTIDDLYLYALPLIVEMPRWPAGRVLEVFDGVVLTGKSVKYGIERSVNGVAAKPAIQVSRYDVLGGEVPARILAALDEAEITQLLGAEAARVNENRVLEFNKQLADYARRRKPAIFDSIYTGTEAVNERAQLLKSACPGLSDAAALTVLKHARADDLQRLETTRRVPLNLLEEARWYARGGRLTRAYAGLRSESMASADSRRLALHALAALPGWPETLRLEVRDGSPGGALLDSIGAEAANEKKYLVKRGPSYQAFNERGEELNSVPPYGDNFFASLMHAMPDDARQALGVPHVSQHAMLQRKIIELADAHRAQAAGWLAPPARRFKPPARINETLMGYYASGRGHSAAPALISLVRDVYPALETGPQVQEFLLRHYRAGKSDRDIKNLLQARLQEVTHLNTTLDKWVSDSSSANVEYNTQVAQALKRSWRRSVLVGVEQDADVLSLDLHDPLPPLTADFSHVRDLTVTGKALNDANADEFLQLFPNVEQLWIYSSVIPPAAPAVHLTLANVPQALSQMKRLRQLSISMNAPRLAEQFPSRLAELTTLEALEVTYYGQHGGVFDTLDLKPLEQLKTLKIVAPNVSFKWPAYVNALASLERLDLVHTSINKIPDELYSGHEQLWSGLSLNWSTFSYAAFKPAFEYVSNYSGPFGPHLADVDEMFKDYAKGALRPLVGEIASWVLTDAIRAQSQTPQASLAAVESLRVEYAAIFDQFYQPAALVGAAGRPLRGNWATMANENVVQTLERSWKEAVFQRYGHGDDAEPPTLMLSRFSLRETQRFTELPELPAGSFSHVKILLLSRLEDVPAAQVRGFLQAFSGVEELELFGGLTEIPFAGGELPPLTKLDLSNNRIVVTPEVQAQLDQLNTLQVLKLKGNRLRVLDVSAFTHLRELNLQGSQLQEWPTGAERLAHLSYLDMRNNLLTTLPATVLNHPDMLMRTELGGNPLSLEGDAALQDARRRIERVRGLPEGVLSRFPPPETEFRTDVGTIKTAAWVATYLLALVERTEGLAGPMGFAARVRRLDLTMTEEQAEARIEQLRNVGLDDQAIETQLGQWYEADDALTRELNGWIFTQSGQDPVHARVSPQARGQAAGYIRSSWRQGVVAARTDVGVDTLRFQRLDIGDLPALTLEFPHVRTLELSGIGISAQGSNGFLTAFSQVHHLILNGNYLRALPEALQHMAQLERLDLTGNLIDDAASLSAQLGGGERLRVLDLSNNSLQFFDVRPFSRLETLNLSHNRISHWPDGALEARQLKTLNLRHNRLSRFPNELLDGEHDDILAATDLRDNFTLGFGYYLKIDDYMLAHGHAQVMGFSRGYLNQLMDRGQGASFGAGRDPDTDSSSDSLHDSDSDSDFDPGANPVPGDVNSDSDGDLEVIGDSAQYVAQAALQPWLSAASPEQAAQRRTLWNQLAQTEGHAGFFHLLTRLRDTSEYALRPAALTERLWDVIAAATENADLRAQIFADAETHQTCIDGRILVFSEMSVRAYQYRALQDVPLGDADLRGQALLNLSRQLFRLERTEQLAEAAAATGATITDRAEVRLQYRIGLTAGWPDGLELPGQPSTMFFFRPIAGEQLVQSRAQILAAENSDAFIEYLVDQGHWVEYLKERYSEPLAALETELDRQYDALETAHIHRSDPESYRVYNEAIGQFEVEKLTARKQKLMEVCRAEIQRLANALPEGVVQRPSSPQPGPSSAP
ncbi:NEL-type E3 ubiquitin ligase domain-containing protein [Pseudomonas sp. Xaverov 259]|uniref:NEL-type E3 ubiquitin ligase domain-containing protein n=1 Tax=Pseudomonas sp. Xaverov 259 TaxID=2666086 RepID=UPI001C5B3FA5|nr:NEL-type E3 ubiquitin ligase domain-containing protein [Pseudomonas sp. Xaverov 259]